MRAQSRGGSGASDGRSAAGTKWRKSTATLPRELRQVDPEDEPRFADVNRPRAAAGDERSDPQVVLKIRRRKFSAAVSGRADRGHAAAVSLRRQRVPAEWQAVPPARHPGNVHGHGPGAGILCADRAGTHRADSDQQAHDRRAIIEEAAGITKFKTKKRLAEVRLEEAKQNLARVNDIFEEVTRQMNSLKRQASKAERYAKLRDEMRAKLRVVLASKLAQLERESAASSKRRSTRWPRRCASSADGGAATGRRNTRSARSADMPLKPKLRENRERLSQITLEIDRALAQRRHNEERCANWRCGRRSSRLNWRRRGSG